MEAQQFFIKGRKFFTTDPGLQEALAGIYDTPERPRCMCKPGGVEMYVAQFAQYVVKRMPDSGNQHHPTCPSYEPEWGNSGLGDLMGEAVIEHTPGSIEVRVAFPLSRMPGHAISRGTSESCGEINVPRRRMSLHALLHLFWERARTAKYGENGHRHSPIKSSHFLGIGCPFVSTVYGQNECRMSIVVNSVNTNRRLASYPIGTVALREY